LRLVLMGLIVIAVVGGCTRRASVARISTFRAEQLMCGDSSMPLAVYHRALTRTEPDSLAAIAVTVTDSARRQVLVEDVQLWGSSGAVGGPGSSTGTITFSQREPGWHSLRIRSRPGGPRWIYAASLRAGFLDTVLVTVGVPCTLIWRGGT
jgi:hypothetical protein